jgi:ribonuclease BN (tRNA processing enzyme)
MSAVQVTFLGTGDAFSPAGLNQAAYLIQGKDTSILVDCGMTTLAAIKRYLIDSASVDAIVLSHFHGDHYGGLPSLFLDYKYIQERKRPLIVAGPPDIEERCAQLCAALYPDALRALPFPVHYVEMQPELLYTVGQAQISAFPVPHTQFDLSLGLTLFLDGRKILYSGDSGWSEELFSHAQGVDLFICECTSFNAQLATHISHKRLAEAKESLAAKRIVLTHLGKEVLAHRNELKFEIAEDGMQIKL